MATAPREANLRSVGQTPQSDARTDEQLISAIQAGEDPSFDILYFRHRDWIASRALRFTGNQQDALDVTQEVFIYLAKKIPTLHLTVKITTFLYPVIKNIALAQRRKKRLMLSDEVLLSEAAVAPAGEGPAELAIVMAALPEAQREVVLMRFVDDFTLDEIASTLQIPLGTVKSRLHNAIAALRENPSVRKYFL